MKKISKNTIEEITKALDVTDEFIGRMGSIDIEIFESCEKSKELGLQF